ncbi:MAG: amino acid permease [Pseudomonadota bacterium]
MPPADATKTLALPLLTAMVVGSMLAAGIFTVPSSFAKATGPLGLLVVMLVAGAGTIALAACFQWLAARRPDLDAGIFAYALAGFGPYAGFLAAFAYWAGTCFLSAAYFVLIKSALGRVVPAFGTGDTPQAILAASVMLWVVHALILRGTKKAALVNGLVTAAKVMALVGAIVILAFGFDWPTFAGNFWGSADDSYDLAAVPRQVRDATLVAVYIFLGVEGASIYSRYAKRREDVGRATFWGLGLVGLLFLLVTTLAYGVMPQSELAGLRTPSLPLIVEEVVGRPGAVFVGVALLLALTGAFLSRSLLAAEVLSAAARAGIAPRLFARENSRRVPAPALWLSSLTVQGLLLASLFAEAAYTRWFELTSAMIIVPYLLVAAFALSLARNEGVGRRERALATLAVLYTVFLLWAAGWTFLLVFALLFALGTGLYVVARREQGARLFRPAEAFVFGVCVAGGLVLVQLLATGAVRI